LLPSTVELPVDDALILGGDDAYGSTLVNGGAPDFTRLIRLPLTRLTGPRSRLVGAAGGGGGAGSAGASLVPVSASGSNCRKRTTRRADTRPRLIW